MNTDVDTKTSERWTITPEEARAEWIELIGPVSPEAYMAGRFGSPLDHLERELEAIIGHPTFDRGYTLDQMLVICVGVLVSAGLVEEMAKTTSIFEDRYNRKGAPRAGVHWPFCGRGDWALVTAGAEAVSFRVHHVDTVRFILPEEWRIERRIAWHPEESGDAAGVFLSETEAEGRVLTVDPVALVGYDPFVAVVSTAPASSPGHRHFYMVTQEPSRGSIAR